MRKPTALIRIHLPHDVIERLDRLAGCLCSEIKREVPRAALVRALILTQIDATDVRKDLAKALGADPVRRGRPGALS